MPAIIAAGAVAVLGVFADHQNRILSQQALRADVLAKVNLLRARLGGRINGNIQLVRGLVAMIGAEPDIDQKRFGELAHNLLDNDNQLKEVAAAPDFVVSMVYPVTGNERVFGLDYRTNEKQWPSVLRASTTGQVVLTGPIDLVQGGQGLIARFAVFSEHGGNRHFWGLVSAVIDIDRVYRESGLMEEQGIDVALSRHETDDEGTIQFFGPPGVVSKQPVTADVVFPSGSWQIAAVPRGGWDVSPDNAWLLRGLITVAGALVVIPIGFAGRFYAEGQRQHLALRGSEAQQRVLSQRLELALDASRIGVWELDLDTHEVIWDDRLYEIYGTKRKEKRTYQDWAGAIHPEDLEKAEHEFHDAVAGNGPYFSNYRIVRPDGEIRHIRTCATTVRNAGSSPRMIGAEWDVTGDVKLNKDLERAKVLAETRSAELELARTRIEHNALHDSLTGLPNRRYLDQELARLSRTPPDGGRRTALLHVDLDRFKQINDTLGHAAGDAMLVHVARLLRNVVREDDFVARIGGDEFVVLCLVKPSDEQLGDVADRIIREVRRPVAYEGHQCRFGVSIGIAIEDGASVVDPGQLLVNADIALYRAKGRGRNRHELFSKTLQSEILRTKKIADDILGGLERNEFIAYYQPQFDAHTLEIAGVEALIRWMHPTEGLLSPGAFLATAEELNVVSSLDQLVLEQALANFERWTALGLRAPRISVNVSARRLRDEELVESLRRLNIRPGILSFELLESTFLDDTDEIVAWNVDRIKDLGIDIEIDDFGTGYASIVSLLKLQPRRLKIDRQLIQPITKSVRQRHLVESIVEIGKTLGVEVVAEGVETMAHARVLKKIGCHKLQGFAFGQPLSASALEDHIRNQSWRTAS